MILCTRYCKSLCTACRLCYDNLVPDKNCLCSLTISNQRLTNSTPRLSYPPPHTTVKFNYNRLIDYKFLTINELNKFIAIER